MRPRPLLTFALAVASLTFIAFAHARFDDGGSAGATTVIKLASAQPPLLAQAAPPAPQAPRPPLVPCDEAAEGAPCVETVTDLAQIAGVWRRYFEGANSMAYTTYHEDGTFAIRHSPHGEPYVTGRIALEDGLAAISANPDGPAPPPCVAPGSYELRLIRLGERPIALSHVLVGEDACVMRAGDLRLPMVYYEGDDDLAMNPDRAALEQPLVPCPEAGEAPRPCEVIATAPEDAAGIWRHYAGRPDLNAPGGMGYQRINRDGSFVMADAPEHTAAPHGNWPYGSYAFEDGLVQLTVEAEGVPPMCQRATSRFRVYRYGEQPVALLVEPVDDACPPRLQDTRTPFIWVAPAP